MRLIDADKVKQYILAEGFYCDTEADKEATAEKIDELFPTVDAIPKEWIINWLTKQTIPALHTCDYYEAVDMMLDDWEKENESNI